VGGKRRGKTYDISAYRPTKHLTSQVTKPSVNQPTQVTAKLAILYLIPPFSSILGAK
jgi:hypothetical protein